MQAHDKKLAQGKTFFCLRRKRHNDSTSSHCPYFWLQFKLKVYASRKKLVDEDLHYDRNL